MLFRIVSIVMPPEPERLQLLKKALQPLGAQLLTHRTFNPGNPLPLADDVPGLDTPEKEWLTQHELVNRDDLTSRPMIEVWRRSQGYGDPFLIQGKLFFKLCVFMVNHGLRFGDGSDPSLVTCTIDTEFFSPRETFTDIPCLGVYSRSRLGHNQVTCRYLLTQLTPADLPAMRGIGKISTREIKAAQEELLARNDQNG